MSTSRIKIKAYKNQDKIIIQTIQDLKSTPKVLLKEAFRKQSLKVYERVHIYIK